MNKRRSNEAPKSRFSFKRSAVATESPPVDTVRASVDTVQAGADTTPTPRRSEVTIGATLQMTISERSNETITLLSLYSIHHQEDQEKQVSLLISHIESCIIDLLPHISNDAKTTSEELSITTVHVRDVKRTILILPQGF